MICTKCGGMGTYIDYQFNCRVICRSCNGIGNQSYNQSYNNEEVRHYELCRKCDANGKISITKIESSNPCTTCKGTGKLINDKCLYCNGFPRKCKYFSANEKGKHPRECRSFLCFKYVSVIDKNCDCLCHKCLGQPVQNNITCYSCNGRRIKDHHAITIETCDLCYGKKHYWW